MVPNPRDSLLRGVWRPSVALYGVRDHRSRGVQFPQSLRGHNHMIRVLEDCRVVVRVAHVHHDSRVPFGLFSNLYIRCRGLGEHDYIRVPRVDLRSKILRGYRRPKTVGGELWPAPVNKSNSHAAFSLRCSRRI